VCAAVYGVIKNNNNNNKRIGRSAVGVGIPMGIPMGMGMGIEIPSPRQPCESATGFLCRRTASTEHAADTAEAAELKLLLLYFRRELMTFLFQSVCGHRETD